MAKIRYDGSIKYSDPVKKKEPEKLIDYSTFTVRTYKPNKIKVSVAHGEDRYPEESKPPSSAKYDKKGNYIKHQESIILNSDNKDSKKHGMNKIMKENSLSNPYKNNGKKRQKT